MGLSIRCEETDDVAFSGGYARFNTWRECLVRCNGGDWVYEEGHVRFTYGLLAYPGDGAHELLCHDDCEGTLSADVCAKLAEDLRMLIPAVAKFVASSSWTVRKDWDMVKITHTFADVAAKASQHNGLVFL
jgi:hypothetical protein